MENLTKLNRAIELIDYCRKAEAAHLPEYYINRYSVMLAGISKAIDFDKMVTEFETVLNLTAKEKVLKVLDKS